MGQSHTCETHEVLTRGKTQEDKTWNFKIKQDMDKEVETNHPQHVKKTSIGKNLPLG